MFHDLAENIRDVNRIRVVRRTKGKLILLVFQPNLSFAIEIETTQKL